MTLILRMSFVLGSRVRRYASAVTGGGFTSLAQAIAETLTATPDGYEATLTEWRDLRAFRVVRDTATSGGWQDVAKQMETELDGVTDWGKVRQVILAEQFAREGEQQAFSLEPCDVPRFDDSWSFGYAA